MIYFTQDSGTLNVKIGYTADDPEARRRALQTGCPSPLVLLASMDGSQDDERRLHKRFEAARVAGEWFKPVPELIALICSAAAGAAAGATRKKLPWPITVYLAGKMATGMNNWRDRILDWSMPDQDHLPDEYDEATSATMPESWPVKKSCVLGLHHYAGPYHILSSEKHCPDRLFRDREGSHGVGAGTTRRYHGGIDRRREIVSLCFDAIERCDVLFAWISDLDCYGTITEIGYAQALGKEIWISGPRYYRDMWFVYEHTTALCGGDDTPENAAHSLGSMIGCHRYLFEGD